MIYMQVTQSLQAAVSEKELALTILHMRNKLCGAYDVIKFRPDGSGYFHTPANRTGKKHVPEQVGPEATPEQIALYASYTMIAQELISENPIPHAPNTLIF